MYENSIKKVIFRALEGKFFCEWYFINVFVESLKNNLFWEGGVQETIKHLYS